MPTKPRNAPTEKKKATVAVASSGSRRPERVKRPTQKVKENMEDEEAKKMKMIATTEKKRGKTSKKVARAKRATEAMQDQNPVNETTPSTPTETPSHDKEDIADLRRELDRMRKQLDKVKERELESNTNERESVKPKEWWEFIPDGSIPRPQLPYCLKEEMNLDRPGRSKLYYQCHGAVQTCMKSAVFILDYNKSWKGQDPETLRTVLAAAVDAVPYLKKFSLNWAAEKFAHTYFDNHRQTYRSKDNLQSYIAQRRLHQTNKGKEELERLIEDGRLEEAPQIKRQVHNKHYDRSNRFISNKTPLDLIDDCDDAASNKSDDNLSESDKALRDVPSKGKKRSKCSSVSRDSHQRKKQKKTHTVKVVPQLIKPGRGKCDDNISKHPNGKVMTKLADDYEEPVGRYVRWKGVDGNDGSWSESDTGGSDSGSDEEPQLSDHSSDDGNTI